MHGGACAARSAAAEGVPLLIQAISHASQRELTALRESPSGSCARFNPLPPFSALIRLSRYLQTTATLLALLIRSPIGSQACTAPPAAAAAPARRCRPTPRAQLPGMLRLLTFNISGANVSALSPPGFGLTDKYQAIVELVRRHAPHIVALQARWVHV